MKKILTIAGSDPGGGAGIQADLKTFAALGCYGMSAITAIAVQNTLGVSRVFPLPANCVEEQIRAVLSDYHADALKIGMLFDKETILAVEKAIQNFDGPIILDPVMHAKGGCLLMKPEAKDALKCLFSRVLLVTPNAIEAEILGNIQAKNVLIKGGHSRQPDRLYLENGEIREYETSWIDTPNTHGTGCTYASAIASYLALGAPLAEAVSKAKAYLHNAILHGSALRLGKGHGPVHHFWKTS